MKQKVWYKTSSFIVMLLTSFPLISIIVESILKGAPKESAWAQIGLPLLGAAYQISRSKTVQTWLAHEQAQRALERGQPLPSENTASSNVTVNTVSANPTDSYNPAAPSFDVAESDSPLSLDAPTLDAPPAAVPAPRLKTAFPLEAVAKARIEEEATRAASEAIRKTLSNL